MNKKKTSLFIKIFLILISIFTSFGIGISKFSLYKGTDFIKGNTFGYCENLKSAITSYVSNYGDIVIKNGKLSIESSVYTRTELRDGENITFILHFENVDGDELDSVFNRHYAKVDVYKGNHNQNSISFALFGRNKFISYIFDPSKELKYTQYESKIEGNFASINNFSFKTELSDSERFDNGFKTLLNSVGVSYKESSIKKNAAKIAIYSAIVYMFALSILMIFNKKIQNTDIYINAISIILICGLPYLLISKANLDILLLLALTIGTGISLVLGKRVKNV